MNIAKYNIAPGSGSNASVGSTAVAGGGGAGVSVDLTPITDKVALLESKVSQLENLLSKVNAALSAIPGQYLSKFGDRSDYSYSLGAIYTDFIQSEMYTNGVGIRIAGNATAAVDDKYDITIKDVGWTQVAWNTVQQESVTVVDSNTDEATAQLNTNYISIGTPNTNGFILLECGAQLTNERCFTPISQVVEYSVRRSINGRNFITEYTEAETNGEGKYILHFATADAVAISIKFKWTYAFRQTGTFTSGTYRLYIQGTDPDNSLTDCFAAAVKEAKLNASGITVMQGQKGARITCDGVQVTNDGGTTWT